ncbi:MAG: SCP2 sterol-binding domain-containing protein [Oceanococcus sp.]
MSLLDQVLGPLEIALNKALSASPQALAELDGAQDALALELRDIGWSFRMIPVTHGVQLLPGHEDARATVSTSLVGLARLFAGEDPRAMGEALRMQGDAEYADRIMTALRGARIDLQAELSSLLGPLGASGLGAQLTQGAKGLLDFGRQSLQSLLVGSDSTASSAAAVDPDQQQSLLAEGQAADAKQTHQWMDEVDDTATALDRLEARIGRLENQRNSV